MRIPLRWAAGDRARWRGTSCEVEYVADDGALIAYRRPGESIKFAIVGLDELDLPVSNGGANGGTHGTNESKKES